MGRFDSRVQGVFEATSNGVARPFTNFGYARHPRLLLDMVANTAAIDFDAGNLRAPEQVWCRLDRR